MYRCPAKNVPSYKFGRFYYSVTFDRNGGECKLMASTYWLAMVTLPADKVEFVNITPSLIIL